MSVCGRVLANRRSVIFRFPVWACLLVLLVAPVASAEATAGQDPQAALNEDLPEQTLVARLPLGLSGDIEAWSREGAVRVAAGEQTGIPNVQLSLFAPHAVARFTNWSHMETAANEQVDQLNQPGGTSRPADLNNVELRLHELGPQFILLIQDGAFSGATYQTMVPARAATLDLLETPEQLGYADDPIYLDYNAARPAGDFVVRASDLKHTVTGDFKIFIFDTTATVLHENATRVYETGRWVQEDREPTGLLGTSARRTTTTAFLELDVYDATLELAASGGDQAVYAGNEDIAVAIDGEIRASATTGSLRMGDRTIRATGDAVRASGTFLLVPINVIDIDDRQAVFAMASTLETLSVGMATFDNPGTVAAAATGIGLLAALVAAYFWPALKLGLLVPLYAKLTKDKVLDQETRNLVHTKVEHDPGCQVQDIADSLSVSWTTAAYHVRVLRKMGLLIGRQKGRHLHLFVSGSRDAMAFEAMAALKNDTARDILSLVLRRPGVIQKDLCESLGIAASTASWHIARLRDHGLLREEKEWKMRRYFAGPAAAEVPLHLGRPETVTPLGVSA